MGFESGLISDSEDEPLALGGVAPLVPPVLNFEPKEPELVNLLEPDSRDASESQPEPELQELTQLTQLTELPTQPPVQQESIPQALIPPNGMPNGAFEPDSVEEPQLLNLARKRPAQPEPTSEPNIIYFPSSPDPVFSLFGQDQGLNLRHLLAEREHELPEIELPEGPELPEEGYKDLELPEAPPSEAPESVYEAAPEAAPEVGPPPAPLFTPALAQYSRSLRKRTTNQMRPYTYDRRKYGQITRHQSSSQGGLDVMLQSSPQEYNPSSPADDSIPTPITSSQPIPQSETTSGIESSSLHDPVGDSLPPRAIERHRAIESSDVEVSSESEDELSDASVEDDFDEMVTETRVVVDLTNESRDLTDFMRVASKSHRRNGERRKPVRKYIWYHENVRANARVQRQRRQQAQTQRRRVAQGERRQAPARNEARHPARPARQTQIDFPMEPRRRPASEGTHVSAAASARTSASASAAQRPASAAASTASVTRAASSASTRPTSSVRPTSSASAASACTTSACSADRPSSTSRPFSRVPQKRTRDAAARLLNVTVTSNRKRRRMATAPPSTTYYAPIIQQEDGSYYQFQRPQPSRTEIQLEPSALPRARAPAQADHSHQFCALSPPTAPLTFERTTFAGSNSLTLLDLPEPWNGINNHQPILEVATKQQITGALDLYAAYMLDSSIQAETFEAIYTYLFQLGAELLRPDTLVEESLREFILGKCVEILKRLVEQLDGSVLVVKARFAFVLFTLSVGFSTSQLLPTTQPVYGKLQSLTMQFLMDNIGAVLAVIMAPQPPIPPPLGREAVALELAVVMLKLDVLHSQMLVLDVGVEMHWQLVFLDAFLKRLVRHTGGGWEHVHKLISAEKLAKSNLHSALDRCLTLLRDWKWPVAREIPTLFFEYIAGASKYADPNLEVLEIPAFIVNMPFTARCHATAFESFLELLGYTFAHLPAGSEASILRHRVTPMTAVSVESGTNPTLETLSGLSQRLAIMIVLMRMCPAGSRPSVEQALGISRRDDTHLALTMKTLTAWSLLIEVVNSEAEQKACGKWLGQLLQGCLKSLGTADPKSTYFGQLQRLFIELHKIMLRSPHASRYYSGLEIKPLDHNASKPLKAVIWRTVQQLPPAALKTAFPTIRSYFESNLEPMHIYVQVMVRLKTSSLEWPHPSTRTDFLVAMLRAQEIPRAKMAPEALVHLAKPDWDAKDVQFLELVRASYSLPEDRVEQVQDLIDTEALAELVLRQCKDNWINRNMDNYEQMVYSSFMAGVRVACFNKYPQLANEHTWFEPATEQSKNTVRDYVLTQQAATLQYFLSHKIRIALNANDMDSLVTELVGCVELDDSGLTLQAFDMIVNQTFSFWVWVGIAKPRMHNLIPVLVEAAIKTINLSDCLDYDPKPFVQSLIQYTQVYLSRGPPYDWVPISQFLRLCGHCVRQLYVRGDSHDWEMELAQLEELLKDIDSRHTGNHVARTELLRSYEGEAAAVDDFLGLDIPTWSQSVPLLEQCRRLKGSLLAFKGTELLL